MESVSCGDARPDELAEEFVGRLFAKHSADLHRYAARRVDREVANDVVAETFRRVLEHHDRFDSSVGPERAWLFGITTNILRNHRRTEMRRLAALARAAQRPSEGVDPLISIGDSVDAQNDLRVVLEAAATLDQPDYELLVLSVWEGLSSTEVAAALGIAPGTVRSRLHRIRRELTEFHAAATRLPTNRERNH